MIKKEKIIEVIFDNLDRPVEYITNLGNKYDYETAAELIESDMLENAKCSRNQYGIREIHTNLRNIK